MDTGDSARCADTKTPVNGRWGDSARTLLSSGCHVAELREGAWGISATDVLVETLLDRGSDGDVAEAEAAIERLADAPADDGLVIREIWLLRMRALLAHAHGDDTGYRDYRDRYRAMAESLGFEGHMEWAEAMP